MPLISIALYSSLLNTATELDFFLKGGDAVFLSGLSLFLAIEIDCGERRLQADLLLNKVLQAACEIHDTHFQLAWCQFTKD